MNASDPTTETYSSSPKRQDVFEDRSSIRNIKHSNHLFTRGLKHEKLSHEKLHLSNLIALSCKMPAPVTKNNREMSDRSTSHREERISPSLPTPLPLRDVLLSSGFLKQRDQLHPSKRLTLGSVERALILQRALDLIDSCDSWSDSGAH
jgi:hypothetical protein